MNGVARSKLLALDSSTLGSLARDAAAESDALSRRAHRIVNQLSDAGYVFFISFHQLAELMRHGDHAVVTDRLKFLRGLKRSAWLWPLSNERVPGTIADVMAIEVEAIRQTKPSNAPEVVSLVRKHLFRYGAGIDAVGDLWDVWMSPAREFFHSRLVSQYHKSAATVSIGAHTNRFERLPFDLDSKTGFVPMSERMVEEFSTDVARTIKERGDRSLSQPDALARQFARSVAGMAARAKAMNINPYDAVLAQAGMARADVEQAKTVGDVSFMAAYAHRLLLASRTLGLDTALKPRDIPQRLVPSWQLWRSLHERQELAPRVKGSDLNDGYLACFTPYVDFVEVDKRTGEYLRQIKVSKSPASPLIGNVFRLKHYADLPARLELIQS